MRVLIVTVAGMSTRFSQSLGRSSLKCIYHSNTIEESLLYRLLSQPVEFDRYIVVGGYQFEELQRTIQNQFTEFLDKIILVNNEKYEEYGSGYSLYCGLKAAIELEAEEVVFAEGDLFIDSESFVKTCTSEKSVITCNSEPILASKAVVLYYDEQNQVHYIYDTGHNALVIKEPFLAVYNSGQIWKFTDFRLMKSVFDSIEEQNWQGTNLIFIEKYFRALQREEYEIILFEKWINCNTISDFERI